MRTKAWTGTLATDEVSSWRDLALGNSQEALAADTTNRKPLKLSTPEAWLAQQAAKAKA